LVVQTQNQVNALIPHDKNFLGLQKSKYFIGQIFVWQFSSAFDGQDLPLGR